MPYFWSDQFGASLRFVGRAHAADQVRVLEQTADRLVAIYVRHGVQIGALCVNASRELAVHRAAILGRQCVTA